MREPIVSEVLSVNGWGIVGARCAIRECPVPNKKEKKEKKKLKPIASEVICPSFFQGWLGEFWSQVCNWRMSCSKNDAFVSQLHQRRYLSLVFSRVAWGFL